MKRLSTFLVSELNRGIVSSLLCLLVLTGCSSTLNKAQPILPIVHSSKLLLTEQAFPPSWQVDSCGVGCDRSERPTHSIRTFGRPALAGSVVQQVYVSQDAETAHAQFVHLRDAEFAAWLPPKGTSISSEAIQYRSSGADEVAVGCGKDEVEACKVFLRYHNYVVQFYFDIDGGEDDGLHFSDIAPILKDMDAQITRVFRVVPSTS